MRWDVEAVLKIQYHKAKKWQKSKNIQFELTLDDFIGLWSPYRLSVLENKLDQGLESINRYLTDANRPVCGWRDREAKSSGVMTKNNALIDRADHQLAKFKLQRGEKHRPESIEKMRKPKRESTRQKMCKPKSEAAKANMSTGQKARWAKYRVEKGR